MRHDSLNFSLASYLNMIVAARQGGYRLTTVFDFLTQADLQSSGDALVLRHDVDRRPENALAMAQAEHQQGVRSTYYFRVVGSAYEPEIIKTIAGYGHEIGYHYEDFHLAGYYPDKAFALFEQHLADLRTICPIRTIAMHGSPLSRFNNMDLWKTHSFGQSDVLDCTLSYDWSDTVFLTDTGRRFDAGSTNLRDDIGARQIAGLSMPSQVAAFLRTPPQTVIQLSTHPERWSRNLPEWGRQLVLDHGLNVAKRALRILR